MNVWRRQPAGRQTASAGHAAGGERLADVDDGGGSEEELEGLLGWELAAAHLAGLVVGGPAQRQARQEHDPAVEEQEPQERGAHDAGPLRLRHAHVLVTRAAASQPDGLAAGGELPAGGVDVGASW